MEPCECKGYGTRSYTGTLQALYRSTGYPPTPLPPYPTKPLSTPLYGDAMRYPQIGDIYLYWMQRPVLFVVTYSNPIQVNLRRIDNGKETIHCIDAFHQRFRPLA